MLKAQISTIIAASLAGCAGLVSESSQQAEIGLDSMVYLRTDQAIPDHDVTLTWTNFDGVGSLEQANIIWNGELIGAGSPAVVDMLSRLAELPPGSRVLVYPRYPYPAHIAPADGIRLYPFHDAHAVVRFIAANGRLILILSPRNAEGQLLHPNEEGE